jgi:oligopeptide transport system substrate-binding protein
MVLSDSSNNTVHYKSPAFDKLIADTLKVTDEAQRSELYSKAEQQLDKDLRLYRFITMLMPAW